MGRLDIHAFVGVGLLFMLVGIVLGSGSAAAALLKPSGEVSDMTKFAYLLLLTIFLQGFHWIEHIAQMFQAFVVHTPDAHGLIGQFDLEQVHFVFNTLYLALMVAIFVKWLAYKDEINSKWWGVCAWIIFGTVVVQGYHEVEHFTKLYQYLRAGTQGTPGILGNFFNGVVFHFLMNAFVFIPILIVFLMAGVQKHLRLNDLLRRNTSGPSAPAYSER